MAQFQLADARFENKSLSKSRVCGCPIHLSLIWMHSPHRRDTSLFLSERISRHEGGAHRQVESRRVELERENEIELARRLIAGDVAVVERFVEHFRRKIFRHAWLMCGHREDAEEVAQEALLRMFQNVEQLREPEHVRAWAFRIARNECLMKRRKSVFAPEQELSLEEFMPAKKLDGDRWTIQIADWSRLPEDQVLQGEMKTLLDRGIAELPGSYRSVLLLRDMEELSTQETAQILDLTEDVVKTRLHRARLALRKILDDHLRARNPLPGSATVPAGALK